MKSKLWRIHFGVAINFDILKRHQGLKLNWFPIILIFNLLDANNVFGNTFKGNPSFSF